MEDDHVDKEVSGTARRRRPGMSRAAGGRPGKRRPTGRANRGVPPGLARQENPLQANLGASAADLMHIRSNWWRASRRSWTRAG